MPECIVNVKPALFMLRARFLAVLALLTGGGQCWPGGTPPGTPRFPLGCSPTHRPLARAGGPGSLGRYERLSVTCWGSPAGTGRSPGPVARGSLGRQEVAPGVGAGGIRMPSGQAGAGIGCRPAGAEASMRDGWKRTPGAAIAEGRVPTGAVATGERAGQRNEPRRCRASWHAYSRSSHSARGLHRDCLREDTGQGPRARHIGPSCAFCKSWEEVRKAAKLSSSRPAGHFRDHGPAQVSRRAVPEMRCWPCRSTGIFHLALRCRPPSGALCAAGADVRQRNKRDGGGRGVRSRPGAPS
jgi:hypothetical protein